MQNQAYEPEQVLREVQESGKQKIKVAVSDMDGILRGKYMNMDKFLSASVGGFGFCSVVFGWDCQDVCYDNVEYTGWHTGYPDAWARLDFSTYRRVPWDDHVPFFLADFENQQGHPLEVCPRQLLKKVIKRVHAAGFDPVCSLEFEWFNFKETPQTLADKQFVSLTPLTPGMFGYSLLRSSANQPYFAALMEELQAFRVPIEGLHTETGPGVLEAAIRYSGALEAADRAVLFKAGAKEIGLRFGIMPTFMAKWNPKLPGCSGHIHQSLWDASREEALFHDPSDSYRMSPLFKHYLAGQMHCLPEILPFFAPNVNSYKRLVEGAWAPTRVTWGVDNRTTAFRVIPGSPSSTRLETRVNGSDANPYLAVAAALASGLYGIEHNLELPAPPVRGNGYAVDAPRLPRNLQEATENLARSEVARELFGEKFVNHFVNTRRWEWRRFQESVTSWELERYFEII